MKKMKINKIVLSIIAIGISTNVNAGFKELTWHSRSNCARINESITWQFGRNLWLKTEGYHYAPGNNNKINHAKCELSTGWQNTWRSADVHWTEGTGGWLVYGDHYILDNNKQPQYLGETKASDCNIYDGWWDQDPPKDKPKTAKLIIANRRDNIKPIKGIHIVDPSQIDIPLELIKEESNKIKEMHAKGFYSIKSDRAIELLAMDKADYVDPTEKYDTGLKHDLSAIKLAFNFTGIRDIEAPNIIGYAVQGTYLERGWTGIAEYYKDKDLGVCTYVISNIELTGGGINLRSDLVSYDIKSKPTIITTEGNVSNGFLTSIEWFDNTYIKKLECASSNLDSNIKTKLINRANELEDYLR
jgi:hypothetical protein